MLDSFTGEKKRLLIKKTVVAPYSSEMPGVFLPDEGLVVSCGDQSLRLLEVQLEGKKALPAHEFLKGIPKKEFSIIMHS